MKRVGNNLTLRINLYKLTGENVFHPLSCHMQSFKMRVVQHALKPPGVVAKLNPATLDKEQQEPSVICMPQKTSGVSLRLV